MTMDILWEGKHPFGSKDLEAQHRELLELGVHLSPGGRGECRG